MKQIIFLLACSLSSPSFAEELCASWEKKIESDMRMEESKRLRRYRASPAKQSLYDRHEPCFHVFLRVRNEVEKSKSSP